MEIIIGAIVSGISGVIFGKLALDEPNSRILRVCLFISVAILATIVGYVLVSEKVSNPIYSILVACITLGVPTGLGAVRFVIRGK